MPLSSCIFFSSFVLYYFCLPTSAASSSSQTELLFLFLFVNRQLHLTISSKRAANLLWGRCRAALGRVPRYGMIWMLALKNATKVTSGRWVQLPVQWIRLDLHGQEKPMIAKKANRYSNIISEIMFPFAAQLEIY